MGLRALTDEEQDDATRKILAAVDHMSPYDAACVLDTTLVYWETRRGIEGPHTPRTAALRLAKRFEDFAETAKELS
jgi:hypothetical protein